MTLSDNPSLKLESPDPNLIATAAKSNRFFLFTNREPISISADEHDRDVYNEKPSREEQILAQETDLDSKGLRFAKSAILHTSMGQLLYNSIAFLNTVNVVKLPIYFYL